METWDNEEEERAKERERQTDRRRERKEMGDCKMEILKVSRQGSDSPSKLS